MVVLMVKVILSQELISTHCVLHRDTSSVPSSSRHSSSCWGRSREWKNFGLEFCALCCLMPWLQLRSTTIRLWCIAHACFQFDASKKWNVSFSSWSYHSRIAVKSNTYCNLDHFRCVCFVVSSYHSRIAMVVVDWAVDLDGLGSQMSTTVCVKSNPRSTSTSADMTGEVATWRRSWFAEPPFLFHVLNPTFS